MSLPGILLSVASIFAIILVGCTPAQPGRPPGEGGPAQPAQQPAPTTPSRKLVAAVKSEPSSLATRSMLPAGQADYLVRAMFNAEIAELDVQDQRRAMLVESLPQLNTDAWRLLPDGTMETTYRLKPNLTWHDGTPLTAEDFAFSWKVFTDAERGTPNSPPFRQMSEVRAGDARTFVVRWNSPYPDAGSFTRQGAFPPMPRHLLEAALEQESAEGFNNHPSWHREFVGTGAFKLERWEPGSFMEATAFTGYVHGAPKIGQINILFIGDANTALSNLLAGEVQIAADTAIGVNQALLLKREWDGSSGGKIVLVPSQWRATYFQARPDVADPREILDVRVRRAMTHALDKQALVEILYGGVEQPADSFVSPLSIYGVAADRVMAKYPFDLRRTEQLMVEAGFSKGPDGYYAPGGGRRFNPELKTNASSEFETEQGALASAWRQGGFDVQEAINPTALSRDREARSMFRSMFTNSGGVVTEVPPDFTTRYGWVNAEYDRLTDTLEITLEAQERASTMAQIVKVYTEELPAIPLRYASHPWAYVSGLNGFQVGASEASVRSNLHLWELR
jgi:peptide/nickel transport system substrate-binding protein